MGGNRNASALLVRRTYRLIRPIFGFWEDVGTIVRIPAWAKITLGLNGDEVSICKASLDGRMFLAFHEDIRNNGLTAEPQGDLTHDQ